MRVKLTYQQNKWIEQEYDEFEDAAKAAVEAARNGGSFIQLVTDDGTRLDVHLTMGVSEARARR